MPTWKAGGYLIRQYLTDHDPLHVHVFIDGVEVAKVAIPSGEFLSLRSSRHEGRILSALRSVGLVE